jgi:hypothetical protein
MKLGERRRAEKEVSKPRTLAEIDYLLLVEIASEVGEAVSHWKREAKQMSLSGKMIERMESAFEHRDSKAAKALGK